MPVSHFPDGVTSALTPLARRSVAVVLLGGILAMLDATVVNVAVRSLSTALLASLDTVQWVITAYLLAQAAVLPVTGWAARRIGAKRLYLVSLLVFTLASICCAASGSIGELIAARVVQGIGGGALLPAGQMILAAAAGPRGLARVMAAAGIPVVLTPVVGPTLGGLLLEYGGWQWIFLINVPIGLLGVALAARVLPADTGTSHARLDVTGLGLASFGMVGVTYALTGFGSGPAAPRVLLPLAVGTLATVAFVVRSLRVPHPILDLRLYRDPLYSSASLATVLFGAATFGAIILMPLYFQVVRGLDAAHTGLLLAPQGLGAAAAMALSGPVFDRIGGRICVLGSVIGVAATVPFVFLTEVTPYWMLALAMAVRGAGIGFAVMPAMTVALGTLDADRITDATPQLNIMQRLGGSVGTALFVVVLDERLTRAGAEHAGQAAAFGATFVWVLAAAVVATVPSVVMAALESRAARRRDAVPRP